MEFNPIYPIYIPSKNRSDFCYTAQFFLADGVKFKIVVELSEFDKYCKVFGKQYVLKLPKNDQGLIYVRTWIREHSEKQGFKRHWQFDDNIRSIKRLYKNKRIKCNANIAIKIIEDFTDRYTNIAISGFQYAMFIPTNNLNTLKPFLINQHVYSGFLFNNEFPYKWRLQWSDDVDICLQVVTSKKDCTVLFYTFLIDKLQTMLVKGGLTTLYADKNTRLNGAKLLAKQWPKYVKVVKKYGRWHFKVKNNWIDFKTPLKRRTDIDWEKIKNKKYDIKLVKKDEIKSEILKKLYNEYNKNDK